MTSSTTLLSAHNPDLPLGKSVGYPKHYDASLLQPIARSLGRSGLKSLNADQPLPFKGWDLWRGYELSWLDSKGKPQVAVLKAWIPCDSPYIIESKSFKLYLNSLNNERFANPEEVRLIIQADLSARIGSEAKVQVLPVDAFAKEPIDEPSQGCLDTLDVTIDSYQPDPGLLVCDSGRIVTEQLFSRLLRSNCPVTGQPDWASIHIHYTGPAIDHGSLLQYIVSYRSHEGFHEQCAEQIFCDLMHYCGTVSLSVLARYTRRGGLDINPWRATQDVSAPNVLRNGQQ